jgi:hypothetical protein
MFRQAIGHIYANSSIWQIKVSDPHVRVKRFVATTRRRSSACSSESSGAKGTVLSVLTYRECTECDRRGIEVAGLRAVELAQAADGAEPVTVYLDGLEAEALHRNPKKSAPAIRRLSEIQMVIEKYALTGDLAPGREMKPLDDGIWEFKVGDVRLYFYPYDDHPTVAAARVTNGFTRPGHGRHDAKHLRFAQRIRREDSGRG